MADSTFQSQRLLSEAFSLTTLFSAVLEDALTWGLILAHWVVTEERASV